MKRRETIWTTGFQNCWFYWGIGLLHGWYGWGASGWWNFGPSLFSCNLRQPKFSGNRDGRKNVYWQLSIQAPVQGAWFAVFVGVSNHCHLAIQLGCGRWPFDIDNWERFEEPKPTFQRMMLCWTTWFVIFRIQGWRILLPGKQFGAQSNFLFWTIYFMLFPPRINSLPLQPGRWCSMMFHFHIFGGKYELIPWTAIDGPSIPWLSNLQALSSSLRRWSR